MGLETEPRREKTPLMTTETATVTASSATSGELAALAHTVAAQIDVLVRGGYSSPLDAENQIRENIATLDAWLEAGINGVTR
jgi:hypothetical protein